MPQYSYDNVWFIKRIYIWGLMYVINYFLIYKAKLKYDLSGAVNPFMDKNEL